MTELHEARAALERGRRLIVVTPPAVQHAEVVWALAPSDVTTLVICADPPAATDWVAGAPPDRRVHAVTGLARSARVLAAGTADTVAGAPKDLAALVGRSALKLETVGTVVVAWPETVGPGESASGTDTLLAETPDARRIVLTWNPTALDDFLSRHAHRAPMLGTPPRDAEGRPAPPVGPARYVVAPVERRVALAREAFDVLRAVTVITWRRGDLLPEGPVDAVAALDLPSRPELAELCARGPVVLLVSASQLGYARTIAAPLTPLPVGTAADRTIDRAEEIRAAVAELLSTRNVDGELALLRPLFERYDPAEVAAALLAISADPVRESPPLPRRKEAAASRSRLFINVGKRDRAAAKDLVGALIREAGLAKEEIGRIEIRDAFALVEVDTGAVDRAVAGLRGATVRGRRVAARLDRAE